MLKLEIPESQRAVIAQAHRNLAQAEKYLREKTEARKDAEHREKIARQMRDAAYAAVLAAQVAN